MIKSVFLHRRFSFVTFPKLVHISFGEWRINDVCRFLKIISEITATLRTRCKCMVACTQFRDITFKLSVSGDVSRAPLKCSDKRLDFTVFAFLRAKQRPVAQISKITIKQCVLCIMEINLPIHFTHTTSDFLHILLLEPLFFLSDDGVSIIFQARSNLGDWLIEKYPTNST